MPARRVVVRTLLACSKTLPVIWHGASNDKYWQSSFQQLLYVFFFSFLRETLAIQSMKFMYMVYSSLRRAVLESTWMWKQYLP